MPTTAPKPVAPRTRSAEVAAAVVARMAAIEPVRFDLDEPTPIEQAETGTASGPRIVIGKPGRSKVASALGLGGMSMSMTTKASARGIYVTLIEVPSIKRFAGNERRSIGSSPGYGIGAIGFNGR